MKHSERTNGKIENKSLYTKSYFLLGHEVEIDRYRILKDSIELAKFIDGIIDKYDDHPSIFYRGNIFRYFRNFKQVNISEHGRSAKEFNKVLENEGENCYIPSGKTCFLRCNNYILERISASSISNPYNQIKEEQML